MTPKIVKFTDFEEIDPRVFWKQQIRPIPLDWIRYQYEIKNYAGDDPQWSISEWLSDNIEGCWILNYYTEYNISDDISNVKLIVVLGFEKNMDAVMFRMLDGETKSLEHALERG